jgi:hypothetical protein
MDNKITSNDQNQLEGCCDVACCGQTTDSETSFNCCSDSGGTNNCHAMMEGCMNKCRWFPLIPVAIGLLFILLGVHLDVEITRVLWMILAGFIVLMGVLGLGLMHAMKRTCSG